MPHNVRIMEEILFVFEEKNKNGLNVSLFLERNIFVGGE